MKKYLYILIASLTLAGCANRGIGPQGGPKDSIPPVPLHSVPEVGALNFKGKRIEVTFNEKLYYEKFVPDLEKVLDQSAAKNKKTVLMKQKGLSEPEAHRFMQQYAMNHGMKMAEFAARILEQSGE